MSPLPLRFARRVTALICLLLLPIAAIAQLPSPTYGWNLGNTMEATGGVGSWSPAPTQSLINAVHAAGFNTIRIPCAWSINSNQSTNQINASYMTAVTQVVQWAINDGMTVVINDHWDNGWFENSDFNTYNSSVNSKLVSLWTQIANNFKGYGPNLIFACANEPAASTAAQTTVLFQYYQSFVNAVRATGGNNSTRWLMIQGPGGSNIDDTHNWVTAMPNDPAGPGHLAFEVHYYSPYQYCLMTADASWGSMWYFWGNGYNSANQPTRNANSQLEAYVQSEFQLMQSQFTSKGIPVLVGEFGAINRTGNPSLSGNDLKLHQASRTYFDQVVVSTANSMGLKPVYWDDGGSNENSFGLFNRSTAALIDPNSAQALTGGAAQPPPGTTSLTVSPTSLSFGATAGTQSATVSSNTTWTVTDNQTWITVSPTSGSNNATLAVSVTANTGASRTGTVTVTGGGITRTIAVSQAAASSGSITTQAESGVAAGGVTFDSNNAGYNGTGFANFPTSGGTLTLNNVNGNGGGTKSLAIRYANGTTSARTGTITVNGATSNITFNPTGSWTTWATLNVTITLNNTTTNTIKFASTGQDLGNIDQITVP